MKVNSLLALLAIACFCNAIQAQYRTNVLPRVSPLKTISHTIAYTELSFSYSSPKVKNRTIWGDLVPYGRIWRTGANEATVFSISSDCKIRGESLEAGSYSIFIKPEKNKAWKVIINEVHDQWGAFRLDESKNILEFEVAAQSISHQEEFAISIDQSSFQIAVISLAWADKSVSFFVETPFEQSFIDTLEQQISISDPNTSWVAYIQAAEFALDQSLDTELVPNWLEMADQALKVKSREWNELYYPLDYIRGHHLWTAARYHAQMGDYKEAVALGEQMKEIDGRINFYGWKNDQYEIDSNLEYWNSKL